MGKVINSINTENNAASTRVENPTMSGGELGQIQEILFGQQQRSTNEQMQSLKSHVDEQIQTLSNMLNSRLNKLTETGEETTQQHQKQFDQLRAQQESSLENQRAQQALLTDIQQSMADLKTDKVNSDQLAGLLSDMAGFLTKKSG